MGSLDSGGSCGRFVTMKVDLTATQLRRIRRWIALDKFTTPTEAVNAALRQFDVEQPDRNQRLRELRASLALGLEQLDAGQTFDGASVVREIRQGLRKKLRHGDRA